MAESLYSGSERKAAIPEPPLCTLRNDWCNAPGKRGDDNKAASGTKLAQMCLEYREGMFDNR